MGNLCCGSADKKVVKGMRLYRVNEFGEAKLLILGIDNVGKTSLFNKLTDQTDKTLAPTKGFNTTKINYSDGFVIDLWDLGGSQAIIPYWKNYFKNVDGIVFMVDASSKARDKEEEKAFQVILKADALKGVPIQVLCN